MRPSSTDTQQVERQIAATQQQEPSSEQAADLAALRAAAAEGEPVTITGDATAAAPVPDTEQDLAREIVMLVKVAVAILGPMLPSLRRIYTDEVVASLGEVVAELLKKHGYCEDGLAGKWGQEIAAAAIILPLAYQTVHGVRADLAERKAAAEAAAPRVEVKAAGPLVVNTAQVPTEAPGARTVTVGQPIAMAPAWAGPIAVNFGQQVQGYVPGHAQGARSVVTVGAPMAVPA